MSVTADTFGAELTSIICDGRERLWQNRTGEWSGHAPVLFPVCGNCGMKVDGISFPILPHGFAKRSEFVLKERGNDFLTFELCDCLETRKVYPYAFVFSVTYRIEENRLAIIYAIENRGDTLYFSCGGHESFALDGGVGSYALDFPQEEKFTALLHDDQGKLTGETAEFGTGKTLPLPAEFLKQGRTLILRVDSRSVLLREHTGKPLAKIAFDGFPYLLLWHPGDSEMICIEPWHNLPDDGSDKEFPMKEGVICVRREETVRLQRTIEYL